MIIMIAAVARGNAIGRGNDLPWDLPEDLKHFQTMTRGKNVLMGRNTFQSILDRIGKPLPSRHTVVVSNIKGDTVPAGVELFDDLNKALEAYQDQDIWIAGGASIYAQCMPRAEKLYITHIDIDVPDADAWFPEISAAEWERVEEEQYDSYSFTTYVRKS